MTIGVDEAGRGALAGPVVASAVFLDPDYTSPYLCDSKAITAAQRETVFDELMASQSIIAVASLSAHEIDKINILQATMQAMKQSILEVLSQLDEPCEVLIDGNRVPHMDGVSARAIVKGDALEPCISAASIIAKVTRDRVMDELDPTYPLYGFSIHKGYGTTAHYDAVLDHGPIRGLHRDSFNLTRQQALF